MRRYAAAVPKRAPAAPDSPLAAAVARVGDRWTLLIAGALLEGPRRFNDLLDELPGLAPNTLTQRLRHLEAEAVLVARPYSERPRRVVYELSASGRELAGALRLLADWGARYGEGSEPPRHGACGTPLEVVWYCPAGERPVAEEEAAEEPEFI